MAIERTLSLLKPDATRRNLTGQINKRFEDAGLKIIAQKRLHLTYAQSALFYEVHKDRPFFDELCSVISAGAIVAQVLEGENAVLLNRNLMGATDPSQAEAGTIRADLSPSISENTVHGSDSVENAEKEIQFFFSALEIHA
jgi:nucleoside-diphosphate kinase